MKILRPLLFVLFLTVAFGVTAQDDANSVYVTVQDNAALRAGPGASWERLAVLPFATTYLATGRTIDGDWIQVEYTGTLDDGARTDFTHDGVTYGWVSSTLLIWTGNVLNLRIDGVSGLGGELPDLGVTTARAQGPLIAIGPGSEVYQGVFGPAVSVPSPTSGVVLVEATGRIGTYAAGGVWLQFKIGGQFYWLSSSYPPRGYLNLPDASYLFPYSRLVQLLRQNLGGLYTVAGDIGGRWNALASGGAVSCNDIPSNVVLVGYTTNDLTIEPIFAPVGVALTAAQDQINSALASFREVCANPSQPVPPDVITQALAAVAEAERNINLANALLLPLQIRDPIN
jgi:hypothetical protein